MPIEVSGKTLETDEEGYLANINEWEPGVAEVMAKPYSGHKLLAIAEHLLGPARTTD